MFNATAAKIRKINTRSDSIVGYLLIAPTILSFVVFLYIPFFDALRTSFYKYNGMGALTNFVALENYVKVLKDPQALRSFVNTLVVMGAGFLSIPFGFILAFILFMGIKGRNFFSTALFIPYLISMVVVGCIWRFIYDPTIGPLNQFLKMVGLDSYTLAWLSNPKTALLAISVTWIWRIAPFNMLILYANILKMPNELIEAAEIDGANLTQKVFYIIVPYLKPAFTVLFMLAVTQALRLFDIIWVMTKGGPGGASDVVTSYIYTKAFSKLDFGGGSAASVILMLFMLFIMFIKHLIENVSSKKDQK